METKRNFYYFCVTRFYDRFIYKLFVSRNVFVIYDRVIFLLRLYATHLLLYTMLTRKGNCCRRRIKLVTVT